MKRVITDQQLVSKWLSKKKSAKSRGIEFNLGLTSLRNIMKAEKCYFTGLKLSEETLSIDRVDSSRGYIAGNVVACHTDFNSIKGHVENSGSIDIHTAMKGFTKAYKRLSKNDENKQPSKYGYSAGDFVKRKLSNDGPRAKSMSNSVMKVMRISNGEVTLEGCSRVMNASQYEKAL